MLLLLLSIPCPAWELLATKEASKHTCSNSVLQVRAKLGGQYAHHLPAEEVTLRLGISLFYPHVSSGFHLQKTFSICLLKNSSVTIHVVHLQTRYSHMHKQHYKPESPCPSHLACNVVPAVRE